MTNLPAVVAITGEPGIGKSRLLHALRERATGETHVRNVFGKLGVTSRAEVAAAFARAQA